MLFGAAGGTQIVDALGINWKEPHGGAVLRSHVCNRCAVYHRQSRRTRAKKLDELADYFRFADHLGNGKCQVCCSYAFSQSARQMDSDNIGHQKINWLAEHTCLGLDASHTPPDDTQAVDHRGMRIGSYKRVGVKEG